MVYHNYNIESLKIEGNVASVRIKVKYDVPKIIILGKEASIPPKEITIEDTYLFIGKPALDKERTINVSCL